MTLIDEFTRECLAIRVARRLNSLGVLETMADIMIARGIPEHNLQTENPRCLSHVLYNVDHVW